MGRYRPPRVKGTPLITAAGVLHLRQELEALWREERPKVAQIVQDAAKNGDRSENGDYIYGKKRLREIDSRVRFLSKRLEVLKVIDERPADTSRVYFGATVTIGEEDGDKRRITILGPDEFDATRGEVSIDSPIARALLGKSAGDAVSLQSPQGDRMLDVIEITYGRASSQ
ncbi:MAG: transcription elongation factor GreB [Congregibacter sp.]